MVRLRGSTKVTRLVLAAGHPAWPVVDEAQVDVSSLRSRCVPGPTRTTTSTASLKIDLVDHDGGDLNGQFCFTLTYADIAICRQIGLCRPGRTAGLVPAPDTRHRLRQRQRVRQPPTDLGPTTATTAPTWHKGTGPWPGAPPATGAAKVVLGWLSHANPAAAQPPENRPVVAPRHLKSFSAPAVARGVGHPIRGIAAVHPLECRLSDLGDRRLKG